MYCGYVAIILSAQRFHEVKQIIWFVKRHGQSHSQYTLIQGRGGYVLYKSIYMSMLQKTYNHRGFFNNISLTYSMKCIDYKIYSFQQTTN